MNGKMKMLFLPIPPSLSNLSHPISHTAPHSHLQLCEVGVPLQPEKARRLFERRDRGSQPRQHVTEEPALVRGLGLGGRVAAEVPLEHQEDRRHEGRVPVCVKGGGREGGGEEGVVKSERRERMAGREQSQGDSKVPLIVPSSSGLFIPPSSPPPPLLLTSSPARQLFALARRRRSPSAGMPPPAVSRT